MIISFIKTGFFFNRRYRLLNNPYTLFPKNLMAFTTKGATMLSLKFMQ